MVRILLVESNDDDVAAIKGMLSPSAGSSFSVEQVATLSEALPLIGARDFDVILADLNLPDSKGLETALALRLKNHAAALVVVTTLQDEEAALDSLQLGIQDYLVKEEMTPRFLIRAIRYAIHRKKDDSAHRRANKECQELLLQLQSVLENISEGVVISDAEGNVLHMNKEALRFFLCHAPEEARLPLRELQGVFALFDLAGTPVPYDDWPLVRALRGDRFQEWGLEVRRKDTGQTWFRSYSGSPVRDDSGKIILAVITLRDITEKTLMERAIRSAQAQLQMITETMPVGVAHWSRDLRNLWSSPEYARWLHLDPKEVVGHTVAEILGPDAYETMRPYVERVLLGEQVEYETRIHYRGLGARWISGRCMPTLDSLGVPDGWVEVIFDNTRRWDLEHDLRRSRHLLNEAVARHSAELSSAANQLKAETAQRMEVLEELRDKEQMLIQQSRLAAMGEMLGFIAHQWRQPLNVLGLIMQELPLYYGTHSFTPEYLEESTTKGMDIIGQMARTIDDFRAFFKTDKEKTSFPVMGIVEQTLAMVRPSFSQIGIKVEVTAEDDVVIEGYSNEYSQVILNILVNARDALVERGTKEPKIVIRVFSEGERGVVTISDNGGGIREDAIDSIFEPYFTTKGEEGTGLGLYMAKTIIEKKMGGGLSARNLEEGAEFRIAV